MLFRRIDAKTLLRGRRSIAILAPHPDDEMFGCGLLIADAVARGISVTIVVLTDGQASHPGSQRWPPAALAKLRRSETRRGLARLGAGGATVRFMAWRDGALSSDADLTRLRGLLRSTGNAALLAPSPHDFHADHRAAWRIGQALAGRGRMLVAYAVWSRIAVAAPRARHAAAARKRWAAEAHRSQTTRYIADDPDGFVMERHAFAQLTMQTETYYRCIPR